MPRRSFSHLQRRALALVLGLAALALLGNGIHCDPLFDGLRNDPEFERLNRGL